MRINQLLVLALLIVCAAAAQADSNRVPLEALTLKAENFSIDKSSDRTKVGARFKSARGSKIMIGIGSFSSHFKVPEAGVYELGIKAGAGWDLRVLVNDVEIIELKPNDTRWPWDKNDTKIHKIGNVLLRKGENSITLKSLKFPGVPYVHAVYLRQRDLPEAKVIATLPDYKCYYRLGDSITMELSAWPTMKPYKLEAVVERTGQEPISVGMIEVATGSDKFVQQFVLPLRFTGTGTLRLKANGTQAMRPAPLAVFDTKQPPGKLAENWPAAKLETTIDCTKQKPYVHGQGEPKVVNSAAGEYLESGTRGVAPDGTAYSSFMAWKAKTRPGQFYKVEIDYPDDQVRNFTIAFVNPPGSLPKGVYYPQIPGIATGAEYPNSGTMKTMVAYFYAKNKETTIYALNWIGGLAIGLKEIRFYAMDDKVPGLDIASPVLRDLALYNEEPDRWITWNGALNPGLDETIKAAENYVAWARAIGKTALWETITVYGKTIWDSPQLEGFQLRGFDRVPNYPTGLLRLILLKAEQYQLKFIAELHPSLYAIKGLPRSEPGIMTTATDGEVRGSTTDALNVFHPKVQRWAIDLVKDLAIQGSYSPAFKGISIRWSAWKNSGWAVVAGTGHGVNDWTLQQFCQDTGLAFKDFEKLNKQQRGKLLSGKVAEDWKQWKQARITAFYRRMSEEVRAINKDLTIYIAPSLPLEDFGLDADAFDAIPGIAVTARKETYPRARYYKEHLNNADSFNPAFSYFNQDIPSAHRDVLSFSNLYMEGGYDPRLLKFSTSKGHLCGSTYPPGRAFLEHYLNTLRVTQLPEMIKDGGLGYIREVPRYTREFAAEFLCLPKARYTCLANADPVALWQAKVKDKYYFYLVNASPADVTHTFTTDARTIRSLSSGKKLDAQRPLLMPRYSFRSFESNKPINAFTSTVDASYLTLLRHQLDDAKRILAMSTPQEPAIINCTAEDYLQGQRQIEAAAKALRDNHILKFAIDLRAGLSSYANRMPVINGLSKVFVALGEYPVGLYNVPKNSNASQGTSRQSAQDLPETLKLLRILKDPRLTTGKLLYGLISEDQSYYLLFSDRVLLKYSPEGQLRRTMRLSKSQMHAKSFIVKNNRIMLSDAAKEIPPAVKQFAASKFSSQSKPFPYGYSPMHKTADGKAVAWLHSNAQNRSNSKVYTLKPSEQATFLTKGSPQKGTNDFGFADGNLYLSGRFFSKEENFIIRKPLDNLKARPENVWVGSAKRVSFCGPVQAQTAPGIIVRTVKDNKWATLRLSHISPAGEITPFFDINKHYNQHARWSMYSSVKKFPPWGLIYRLEAYANDGYALIVEPLCTVFRLDKQGKVRWAAGVKPEQGGAKIDFKSINDAAVDSRGNLWLVDSETCKVYCLDQNGKVLFEFGEKDTAENVSGTGFLQPKGIETVKIGKQEFLYIADQGNRRILEYQLIPGPETGIFPGAKGEREDK